MSNLPNYPESVTAWDVEAYYYGQRESSALEMIYPRCTECGIEVMVIGMTCDECKEVIAEMIAIMDSNRTELADFAGLCVFFLALAVLAVI